jgi:glutathione synthase/RimK-type ligase-like ATP-grasp enzyme
MPPHPLTIGFATCAAHRDLTADDRILASALESRVATVRPVVWTEISPKDLACDRLILRSVWDYHLQPDAFLNWVREAHQHVPVVNPPEIVRWNMDKHYLLDVEAAGFVVPKTLVLERGARAELAKLMDAAGLNEVVIKPTISASAFETHRVRRQDAARFNDKLNALLQQRAMLVQEFVSEIETGGEWSLVFLGGEFSHAVHKLPRAGDFRVQHEFGGKYRPAAPPQELQHAASAILGRFAPQAAYCRADMVMRAQGPTLMELELIEPLLHFELAPKAAELLAGHLCF